MTLLKHVFRVLKFVILALPILLKSSSHLVVASTEFLTRNLGDLLDPELHRSKHLKVKDRLKSILTAIHTESQRFGFDPVLLLSIVQVESGFKVNRRGSHGEIGLMQLKPSTAKWIAQKYHLPWRGPKSLEDPKVNIQLGTTYLSYLRKRLPEQDSLYLAAYNMGANQVQRSVSRKVIPREYASRVLYQYDKFYSRMTPSQISLNQVGGRKLASRQ